VRGYGPHHILIYGGDKNEEKGKPDFCLLVKPVKVLKEPLHKMIKAKGN